MNILIIHHDKDTLKYLSKAFPDYRSISVTLKDSLDPKTDLNYFDYIVMDKSSQDINKYPNLINNKNILIVVLPPFKDSFTKDEEFSFLRNLLKLYQTIFKWINHNITEKRKAREQEEEESLLEDFSKYEFISNISHEIRSPLNLILGMQEALSSTPLNDDQKKYVDILIKSGNHLLNLVNDILTLGKMNVKNEIEKIDFNLKDFVENLACLTEANCNKKGLNFILNVDLKSDTILADKKKVTQFITNLVGNAIKFTKEGFVKLSIKSLDSCITGDEKLEIIVEDSGIGIKKEDRDVVFEEFYQCSNGATKEFEGTGLGLAIVNQIVHLLNGTIELNSTFGQGTKFKVIIPCEFVKDTALKSKEKKIKLSKSELKPLNILLIDDLELNLFLVETLLKPTQHTCKSASSGEEALNILEEKSFDLILTDIQMPHMDGYEFVQKFQNLENKKTNKKTPIIALSAGANEDQSRLAKSSGFKGYLTKPISLEAIENCLCLLMEEINCGSEKFFLKQGQKGLEIERPKLTGEI